MTLKDFEKILAIEKKKAYDKGYQKGFEAGTKEGYRIGYYKGKRRALQSENTDHDTYKGRIGKKEKMNFD